MSHSFHLASQSRRMRPARRHRPAATIERWDAGEFGVEFHVVGCDCRHCAPEPRLTIGDIAEIGAAGFAIGVSMALLLSFAGHPTETTLSLLAAVGIML